MELKRIDIEYWGKIRNLLIVPYGIETATYPSIPFGRYSFNRTLWN